MLRIAHQRSLIPWAQAVNGVGLVLALVPWTVLATDKVPAELSACARDGSGTGAGLGPVQPAAAPPRGLPRGVIVAFMPDFRGGAYSDPKALRRWLAG